MVLKFRETTIRYAFMNRITLFNIKPFKSNFVWYDIFSHPVYLYLSTERFSRHISFKRTLKKILAEKKIKLFI